MNILQRYRELRSMGQGDSRARVSAAIEYARTTDLTVAQATAHLVKSLAEVKNTPTRMGEQI